MQAIKSDALIYINTVPKEIEVREFKTDSLCCALITQIRVVYITKNVTTILQPRRLLMSQIKALPMYLHTSTGYDLNVIFDA